MKFLLSYKLFEKTSLIGIGVPYSVMQSIQKNYAISDNAQWKNLKYKKDIIQSLNKPQNTLIISIFKNKLFVLFSYDNEYYIETYILAGKDDFGDEQWQRVDRIQTELDDVVKTVERGCKSYELISGNWSHEFSRKRRIKKQQADFEEVTNNFKKDFAENFTKIVKRMYGKKATVITDIIINHLKNVKKNLTSDQIRDILFSNVERTKEIDVLKNKQTEKDPYKLYNDIIMENSLTIFDEYILSFENDYSEKYKEYLNIPIMIDKYGRDKIMTSFCYFLWSKKLMNL